MLTGEKCNEQHNLKPASITEFRILAHAMSRLNPFISLKFSFSHSGYVSSAR